MLFLPISCAVLIMLYAVGMRTSVLTFIASASAFVLSTALSVFYFISNEFTGAGITEATFFHLLYGFRGLEVTAFLKYVAVALLALTSCVVVCYVGWKACTRKSSRIFSYQPSRIIHLTVIGALSVFSIGVHPATTQTMGLTQQLFDTRYASVLNEELRSFAEVAAPKRAKSLIYIYGESFERTFLNQAAFPNLTPRLSALEKDSLSIHGITQAPLTDWTIAGMVASQCGMPLATFRPARNDLADVPAFLPGATCIGDLLHKQGYQLAYMGGAASEFAGKSRFYADHHFDDITSLERFRSERGTDIPVSKWGVYDDMLFDAAFKKFEKLSNAGEPFALVILTLDTHAPEGHSTPACANKARLRYRDGSNKMLNAVKCNDELIANFVRRVEAKTGKDVVIVIASDHLQMNGAATELLNQTPHGRENLFIVRSKDIPPQTIKRAGTTLDIAPTILSILGWNIDGFALGRNLLSKEQTLVEKYGREQFFTMLTTWRMSLWKMWQEDNPS